MGLLARLFGMESHDSRVVANDTHGECEQPFRVFDGYGRELHISREQWRTTLLPAGITDATGDPDKLYSLLVFALEEGFAADIVAAAEDLATNDSRPAARDGPFGGAVYSRLDRLADAQQVFEEHVRQYGDDGFVLTGLAKVHASRGDDVRAMTTLWHALEVDPNQENALLWYQAEMRERHGGDADRQAFEKVASLPGSWLAQLWLARMALENDRLTEALTLYTQALSVAPRPAPTLLLMKMSGDLGNHGHLVELLRQTNPHFIPAEHGLEVGNNLLKANLDLGRFDHARSLLNQLYALTRPDYQEALAAWDTAIAQARTAADSQVMATPRIGMLAIEGPVWLDAASPAASLFPTKDADAVVVCCLGGTIEKSKLGPERLQVADGWGRITRSLPLFLAEQIHLQTTAAARTLQPIVPGRGFVLSGDAWPDIVAAEQARHAESPADYVIVTHVIEAAEPPTLSARLIRTIDVSLLGAESVPFDIVCPERAYLEVAQRMLTLIAEHTAAEPIAGSPPLYRVPQGEWFAQYQLRLEQLLALKFDEAEDGVLHDFLNGEREILLGTLQLALADPQNVTTRLLLLDTFATMQRIRPQVADELHDKVELLMGEHPNQGPAGSALALMFRPVASI